MWAQYSHIYKLFSLLESSSPHCQLFFLFCHCFSVRFSSLANHHDWQEYMPGMHLNSTKLWCEFRYRTICMCKGALHISKSHCHSWVPSGGHRPGLQVPLGKKESKSSPDSNVNASVIRLCVCSHSCLALGQKPAQHRVSELGCV